MTHTTAPRPHLIDLFCGRGGWTKPALARGWRCTGIDTTNHGYPGTLIRRTLPMPREQLLELEPDLIIASPPCEEFARHHLPFRDLPSRRDPQKLAQALELLTWAIGLASDMPCPVIIECSLFAARHVPGARYAGKYAMWGTLPALLPTPRPQKERITGHNQARRAEIPDDLAGWIIDTAPLRSVAIA